MQSAKAVDTSGASTGVSAQGVEDEMAILLPERQAKIGGRLVTVREYTFSEGLHLSAMAKPFLDSLYGLIAVSNSAPTFEQVADVCAQHASIVLDLVAKAADLEREWIDTLDEEGGDLLMLLWWSVNAGFFIRRVLRRAVAERRAANPSNGLESSPR